MNSYDKQENAITRRHCKNFIRKVVSYLQKKDYHDRVFETKYRSLCALLELSVWLTCDICKAYTDHRRMCVSCACHVPVMVRFGYDFHGFRRSKFAALHNTPSVDSYVENFQASTDTVQVVSWYCVFCWWNFCLCHTCHCIDQASTRINFRPLVAPTLWHTCCLW